MSHPGPLSGVRIAAIAAYYPIPFASMLLADLGADVVIVEKPGGEPGRELPGMFEALNRNKRSLCVDFKTPRGHDVVCRLIEQSDVLLDGLRPGKLERAGLGPTQVRGSEPLVYVSVSGFGRTGPLRDRPGHDLSYQAASGWLDRQMIDQTTGAPNNVLSDLVGGLFAAQAVMLGLYQRTRTQQPVDVDVSMVDCLVSCLGPELTALTSGLPPLPIPPVDPGYDVFRCRDHELVAVAVGYEDGFWTALCTALDMPDIAVLTAAERVARRAEMKGRLCDRIATVESGELLRRLEVADVPHHRVVTVAEILDTEHVGARGLVARGVRPDGGDVRYVRQPLHIAGFEPNEVLAAPTPGQHSRQILADLGYGPDEVADLLGSNAVVEELEHGTAHIDLLRLAQMGAAS